MENYKRVGLPFLRITELLCIALTITGFLWASSDLLLTSILVGAPVTPLSVLFMLYGFFGTFAIEVVVRLFNRKTKSFLPQTEEKRQTNG